MPPTLRQAVRQLVRRKSATALSVGLLALGIGLAASFYSLLDSALLSGVQASDGEPLIAFSTRDAPGWPMPLEDYRTIEAAQRSFEWLEPSRTFNTMVTRGSATRGMIGSYVTADLFPALGAAPILGRGFDVSDEDAAGPAVALISHRLWQESYGKDPDILGEEIVINREQTVIVGVMPPGFNFPIRQDVWGIFRQQGREWSSSQVFGIGKLAAGFDLELARQDLERIVAQLEDSSPLDTPRTASLDTFVTANIGDRARGAMRAMVFAALGLLLLTCANLANLRLSETLRRRSELDTRLALGAGSSRIVSLLLIENLLIGLLGGALAVGVAFVLTRALGRALLDGSPLARIYWVEVGVDPSVARFTIGCALLATVAGALAPVISRLSRRGRALTRGATQARSALWTRGLVGVQIGLCFALLVTAGLFGLRARALLEPSLGFRPENLSSTQLSTYQADLRDDAARSTFFERFQSELRQHPEVKAAAMSSSSPWGYAPRRAVAADSAAALSADLEQAAKAWTSWVDEQFFETLELPIVAGRGFIDSDFGQPDSVAIVSRTLAETLFESGAVGRTLVMSGRSAQEPPLHAMVVGVAADLGLDRTDFPGRNLSVYLPFVARDTGAFALVRSQASRGSVRPVLEEVLERIDPMVGTLEELSVDQAMAGSVWAERRLGQVFTLFSVAALLVTLVGIHAVIAVLVQSRRRELGIRAALGARPVDLRKWVLGESGRQLLIGLGCGSLALWVAHRLVDSSLAEGLSLEPAVIVAALLMVAVSSLSASWAPTERAARTDPTRSLRSE